MKKTRFTEEQIIGILNEVEAGRKVGDVCRAHGISEGTYYRWKAKYGGMDVNQMRCLQQLEEENRRNTARAQATRPDATTIQTRLRALATQHPRVGYRRRGVLLRQVGLVVNHKRVYRLYRDAALQVGNRRAGRTRRRRVTTRQPLPQAQQANAQWTRDFMHDSLASGRTFRTLNVVDICTRECLAIEVDTSLGGQRVVRVLERIAAQRGYPQVLRIDNGPEFRGSAVARR